MNTISSTVKKEVNIAVENKLSNTTSNWGKEEVKRHLEFLTKKQPFQTMSQHHTSTTDYSDSSASSSITLANVKETKDNFEYYQNLLTCQRLLISHILEI